MTPLRSKLADAQQFLRRWASDGTWLAIAVLLVVAAWGWLDPFGLRQRLDWMVADQFFRHRTPPTLHPDLLQVSIDDRAADELGFPVPRHLIARGLRQLQSLGARVVLVDVVFSEPKDEPALAEADRQLIPRAAVVEDENLAAQFTEDHVLADAVSQTGSAVLAYYLSVPFRADRSDEPALAAMSRHLLDNPTATAGELAERLRIDTETASRLFDPALRTALGQLAGKTIRENPEITSDEAVTDVFGNADVPAGYLHRFVRALDRARSESLLEKKGVVGASVSPSEWRKLEQPGEPQLPVYSLANAADWLGFADAELDEDGTLRRLPMVKRLGNKLVFHEGLAGAAVQLGMEPRHFRLESDGLRLHSEKGQRVPLDARGRLVINWPMNARRPWEASIPQISLADLVELDRYDFDLKFARHKLREFVAILDQEAKLDDGWNVHFMNIQKAYKSGDPVSAAKLEQKFDRDGIPVVLEHSVVREALERARLAVPDSSDTDDALNDAARNVINLKRQIELIESEQATVRAELDRRVRGKLCLVGDTTTGSTDLKHTPVGSDVPGVSVIAAAANTILTGDYAAVYGYPVSALLMLLVSGILFFPFFRLRPLPAGACASVGSVGTIYASFGLLAGADTVVSPVTAVIGVVALYSTATTYRWLNEYRQKQLVRTIFEAQTNATIVERLIAAGRAGVEEVLTPKNRQVTLFFAEIADFEELAQQVAPERLPELLSRTFGTMDKVIKVNEGTLDRYQGHALVAFFGAPIYQPDHALRACRSALECCDTLRALKTAWQERGLPMPRVHIGLHTGELLVGNIMLTSRVDYTVAGENLNIAYRIGELNETYGTEVMISEATLTRCENMVEARELDLVRIKGRREPLRAFELMSAKGQLRQEQLQLRGAFATGLVAFRNRDYAGALSLFRTCRETSPGDRPATVYIERCEKELGATVQAEASKPGGE